jgi:phosphoglycolate phosphatase
MLMRKTVLFDLDGTLGDPKVGITTCIQFALSELSIAAPSADDLTWCIGPPLHLSLDQLVGPRLGAQALRLYRQRFTQIG